jgi:hypothetical protein
MGSVHNRLRDLRVYSAPIKTADEASTAQADPAICRGQLDPAAENRGIQALLKRIQMKAQLSARTKHLCLHRTNWAIGRQRRLLNRMSEVVSQHEAQTLFVR